MFRSRWLVEMVAMTLFWFYAAINKLSRKSVFIYLKFFLLLLVCAPVLFFLQFLLFSRINFRTLEVPEILLHDECFLDSSYDDYDLIGSGLTIEQRSLSKSMYVKKDDTLKGILSSLNIANNDIAYILSNVAKRNIDKIFPNQRLDIGFDCKIDYIPIEDNDSYCFFPVIHKTNKVCVINYLSINLRQDKVFNVERVAGNLTSKVSLIPTIVRQRVVRGVIKNSLYNDSVKAGFPNNLLSLILNQYSYILDFQRDIKKGDKFTFIFEEIFDNKGNKLHNGNLLYSDLFTSKGKYALYKYKDSFYNIRGESFKKSLLRTPVDGARISSGFGKRKHPILGYTKFHQGIDFAAPVGVPIYSAGDGVIESVVFQNGYGNRVIINHGNGLKTLYAHMSKFSSLAKKGAKINQGQVIGYVGATGMATGPHLHFEIIVNGKKVNPSSQKFAGGKRLNKDEMIRFKSSSVNKVNKILIENDS